VAWRSVVTEQRLNSFAALFLLCGCRPFVMGWPKAGDYRRSWLLLAFGKARTRQGSHTKFDSEIAFQ
jgi:hypothetical protein